MFLDVMFSFFKVCCIVIITCAMLCFFYKWVMEAKITDMIFGFALNILVVRYAFTELQDATVLMISGITTACVCVIMGIRLLIAKTKAEHSRH